MKKTLLVVLMALLLVSCKSQQPDSTGEPPVDKQPDNAQTVTPNEAPEDVIEEGYEEFEYKITARDYDSIYENLSNEQMTREFLSAICLRDLEVLQLYMQGNTTDELMKIKADVMIDGGKVVTEYFGDTPFDGLETKVKFIVSESESEVFPVGVYDYVLLARKTGAFGIEYFGPDDGYASFQKAIVPDKSASPVLYNTYKFIEEYYRNFPIATADDVLNTDVNFVSIMHLAVHTRMALSEDFIFTTTLEEFKEYVSLQFGYTDEAVLNRFANALSNAPYATADENGVYTVCCAHGYGTLSNALVNIEMSDGLYAFTYAIYSDSAYTVQCREDVFIFEENKDSDVMTLIEVQSTTFNDLPQYVFSI